MANSYVIYSGNGATTQYVVTFPFISRDHVTVLLDGSVTAAWTWITDSLIQMNTAPGVGVRIRIQRSSSPGVKLVNYANASELSADDLNLANTQQFYLAQEAVDRALESIAPAADTSWDANGKRIVNIGSPVDPADAVRKADLDAATLVAGNVPDPGTGGPRVLATLDDTTWQWVALLSLLGYTPVDAVRQINAGAGLTGGGDLSANRTLAVDGALIPFLASVNAFTRAQRYTPVVLTDAATVAWDLDVAPHARVTLAGNRTVGAPTNLRDGGEYRLVVIQDGTGGRTLAWNAAFDFGEDGTPTLPSGVGKIAIFGFVSDGTKLYCVSRWNN
jgi:hypothetical protein